MNRIWTLTLVLALLIAPACDRTTVDTSPDPTDPVVATSVTWTTAVEPKPLSTEVNKALEWLIDHQLADGGWGQGEEASRMRGGEQNAGKANVGDTCMAALALLRSGSTPLDGTFHVALKSAIDFICEKVEEAPEEGLSIANVQGTRLQRKIGTYVDTFLASLLLSETRDRVPEGEIRRRVTKALDKVMDKVEKNQNKDGSWDNKGWAPVLTQGIAAKAGNRFFQGRANGSKDLDRMLARVQQYSVTASLRKPSARPTDSRLGVGLSTVTDGSAGVPLYADSANLGALSEINLSNVRRTVELEKVVADPKAPAEDKKQAQKDLGDIAAAKTAFVSAQTSITKRLEDKRFVSGFGNNGGEEFLSYMNLSEALVIRDDDVWRKWDAAMKDNLNRVQNKDGSWTGHHCITGRTFCTSAALLTLMADRTPFSKEAVAAVRGDEGKDK